MIKLTTVAIARLEKFYRDHLGRDPEPREIYACIDELDSSWDGDAGRGHIEFRASQTITGKTAIFEITDEDLYHDPNQIPIESIIIDGLVRGDAETINKFRAELNAKYLEVQRITGRTFVEVIRRVATPSYYPADQQVPEAAAGYYIAGDPHRYASWEELAAALDEQGLWTIYDRGNNVSPTYPEHIAALIAS